MTTQKNKLSSSIIPQSNYRKSTGKKLTTLNTTLPLLDHPINKTDIVNKIISLINIIHHVVFKKDYKGTSLQKKIIDQLFQKTNTKISLDLETIWKTIEHPILNIIKIHYLEKYMETLILTYEQQVGFLINKYKRHLPQHISLVEGDDLTTIAQLELIETFKAWNPNKNPDIWPLAYTRINGAMKDHIRYISKSDPTRFYDWINNAASLYLAINNDNSHETKIENNVELERALKELNEKEKSS